MNKIERRQKKIAQNKNINDTAEGNLHDTDVLVKKNKIETKPFHFERIGIIIHTKKYNA